jgi:Uracil DNA glycosylase superfamily.
MTTESLENDIRIIYDRFYHEVGINPKTGVPEGVEKRFIGAPYLGTQYAIAKKHILYVGLDQGKDENERVHTFDSKREIISPTAKGYTMILSRGTFNPHFYGIYAMTLRLLYNEYGWIDLWKDFSKDEKCTACKTISINHERLPVDLIDYIAFTNAHKFVTINRVYRSGPKDRQWNDGIQSQFELHLLEEEIRVLHPDIVIFQGVKLKSIISSLKIDNRVRIIVMHHPSSRSRYYRSIEYINKIANEIENNN